MELVHELEAEFRKSEGFSSGFRQKFTSILIPFSFFHTSVLRSRGASAASGAILTLTEGTISSE